MTLRRVVTLAVLALGLATSASAATITGSGTTRYIPRFTGSATIGNSVLFQYLDPSGNGEYVGINTVTPLGSLGILCQNGTEIFGQATASPFHHFNIASHNPMHLTAGVNVNGSVFNPLAYTGFGAGGVGDLVKLERKRFTVTSEVGMALGAVPDTEFVAGYRLKVNGRIRAKEIKVDAAWSDFVFQPGYRLAPLSEVERHIQERGHLPGIPTAEQVEREGVSVGEMESKLLQKVEELTLYVITLNKENQALRERLDRLEK